MGCSCIIIFFLSNLKCPIVTHSRASPMMHLPKGPNICDFFVLRPSYEPYTHHMPPLMPLFCPHSSPCGHPILYPHMPYPMSSHSVPSCPSTPPYDPTHASISSHLSLSIPSSMLSLMLPPMYHAPTICPLIFPHILSICCLPMPPSLLPCSSYAFLMPLPLPRPKPLSPYAPSNTPIAIPCPYASSYAPIYALSLSSSHVLSSATSLICSLLCPLPMPLLCLSPMQSLIPHIPHLSPFAPHMSQF